MTAKQSRFLLYSSSLVFLFYLSAKLHTYLFLRRIFGFFDAYLIDQFLFFGVFSVLIWIGVRNKLIHIRASMILVTLLYVGFVFLTQSEILERYFIKDDIFVMIPAMLHPEAIDYRYTNKLDYFYYHFGVFSLLFRFFRLEAFYYNIFTMVTMGFAGAALLYLFKWFYPKGRLVFWSIAVLSTLFFLSSPNILDSFMYMEHSTATGYIAICVVLSAYFYLRYLKERSLVFFFTSYSLLLFLLRTAMTRAGFWAACLVLLEFSFFFVTKKRKDFGGVLARSFIILLPFYFIAKPYLVPASSGRLYGLNLARFVDADRLYLFFANFIPAFIPYQFWRPVYMSIRLAFLDQVSTPTQNFFLNNLLFVGGVVFFTLVSLLILFLFFKRINVFYVVYFWICTNASLLFYMLFGNVSRPKDGHIFDISILNYGVTPGSRYYPLPIIFLTITFFIIAISVSSKLKGKFRGLAVFFAGFVLLITVGSNIVFSREANRSANGGIIIARELTEGVLGLVPDNNEKKVVYSVSGEVKPFNFIIRLFDYFYKYTPPVYITTKEDLLRFLKDNHIKGENFYAFTFDQEALVFQDKSAELRKEFELNLGK